MKDIILIHQKKIQHYRVSVYNYLYNYLLKKGYNLRLLSGGVQDDNPYEINFPFTIVNLDFLNLAKIINKQKPDALIFFVDAKNLYLIPLIFYSKILRIKTIYWGHGINLQKKSNKVNIVYRFEHKLFDAIVLYANHLKKYINAKHLYKTFVANNTLNMTTNLTSLKNKKKVLSKYNIRTQKNIIFVGRIQKRKRINDLVLAFKLLCGNDTGLILVGEADNGILNEAEVGNENIYIIGPKYGNELLELLKASYIYCIPGAIGLGIVHAFHFGLPVVTEKVDHGPEIMYFKDGINGFMVEKGNLSALAEKMRMLLDNDKLREQFSKAAKQEIETKGHINNLCKGFLDSLDYLFLEQKK